MRPETAHPATFIRAERERHGLSQADLASMLHISVRTLQNWENGRHAPQMKFAEEIATAFDLSIAEVISLIGHIAVEASRRRTMHEHAEAGRSA